MNSVKIIKSGGERICAIEAPIIGGVGQEPSIGVLGYLCSDLEAILHRGEKNVFASFCGNVANGMILTRHIFKGLTRPLLTDRNNTADQDILIYSQKPAVDWEWQGDKYTGNIVQVKPIGAEIVFVVIVSPNKKHKTRFPEIDGWIGAWNWIDEDGGLREAPRGWVDRYNEKVWTRTKSLAGGLL